MKKLLFIFSVFISFTYFSQISFYKTFSDGGYDVGEGVVQLADSSYLITGSSSSFQENNQAFILKLDSLGNKIWSNHYGGSEADRGRRIFHVPNDGIYIVGQTNSFGNFYDAYFFKTDENGTFLFEKNYGSSAYENIFDAVMLKDTTFILVGETTNTPNESENIYLLRINKFGDTLWTKNFGSEQKDVARSIQILNDTIVYIAGEYYVEDSLTQKALLIRMHIDGTLEWLKTFGNIGKSAFNDIHVFENQIRAVGYNQSENFNNADISAFNMRLDLDGNVNIDYSLELMGTNVFEHITKYGVGNSSYYLTVKTTNNPDVLTYNDGFDLFMFRYHQDMYYEGIALNFSNLLDDIANEVIPTSDGGALLIGYNHKPSIGGTNILVSKVGANDYFPFLNSITNSENYVNLNELELENKLNIYPNPSKDVINFINENGQEKIIIFDLNGLILYEETLENNIIDISFLNQGFYIIQINEKRIKFHKTN
jgi:hypothetical protein